MNPRIPNFRAARIVLAALAAACLAGLNACGPEPLAGGTLETTNGITARVVLPTGQPASNIKVYLLDEQDWLTKIQSGESLVLDSAETDTGGVFKIGRKMDTAHVASLYANVETYGLLIHDITQGLVKTAYKGKIGLTKKVNYEGRFGDRAFGARRVYLSGSPFAADVDSAGHFILTDVPQERYSVVVKRKLADKPEEFILVSEIDLNEWTPAKPDTLVPDTSKSLLIENFEDLDNQNLLMGALGGGSGTGLWEANDDQYLGGNSKLLQPANDASQNFTKAIVDGGGAGTGAGDRSRSLHVTYLSGTHPGQDQSVPWVRLANNIGRQAIHFDFSGMDSLTFYSKGNGKLVVEFLQQNPPPFEVSLSLAASVTLDLGLAGDTGWRKYSVKPSDLKVEVGWFPSDPGAWKREFERARLPAYTKPPVSWEEMGGLITQIRFRATGGSEFWLDEIRVHGVNVGDLVK